MSKLERKIFLYCARSLERFSWNSQFSLNLRRPSKFVVSFHIISPSLRVGSSRVDTNVGSQSYFAFLSFNLLNFKKQ